MLSTAKPVTLPATASRAATMESQSQMVAGLVIAPRSPVCVLSLSISLPLPVREQDHVCPTHEVSILCTLSRLLCGPANVEGRRRDRYERSEPRP